MCNGLLALTQRTSYPRWRISLASDFEAPAVLDGTGKASPGRPPREARISRHQHYEAELTASTAASDSDPGFTRGAPASGVSAGPRSQAAGLVFWGASRLGGELPVEKEREAGSDPASLRARASRWLLSDHGPYP